MEIIVTAFIIPVLLAGAATIIGEAGYRFDLRSRRPDRDLPPMRLVARRETDRLAAAR